MAEQEPGQIVPDAAGLFHGIVETVENEESRRGGLAQDIEIILDRIIVVPDKQSFEILFGAVRTEHHQLDGVAAPV